MNFHFTGQQWEEQNLVDDDGVQKNIVRWVLWITLKFSKWTMIIVEVGWLFKYLTQATSYISIVECTMPFRVDQHRG